MKRRFAILLCVGLFGSACASSDGSDDDAKKAKTDKKKSKKKKKKKDKKKKGDESGPAGSARTTAKNDDGSIPPPEPGEVPDFKIGAWMTMQMKVGRVTWGLLEKRGTEMLVDANVRGPFNLDIQAWVDVPKDGAAKSTELKSLKYRMNGGAIQSYTGGALDAQQKIWANFMTSFIPVKFEGLPQEDVTVPAGTFRGCYRWISKSEFMGKVSQSTIWSHPAVPAPAMVKMRSEDGSESVLVEYGQTGAKASL